MKTHDTIVVFFVFFLAACGFKNKKNKLDSDVNKKGLIDFSSESHSDDDIILSEWYVYQSESSDILNNVVGSKISLVSKFKSVDSIIEDQIKVLNLIYGEGKNTSPDVADYLRKWRCVQIASLSLLKRVADKSSIESKYRDGDFLDILEAQRTTVFELLNKTKSK